EKWRRCRGLGERRRVARVTEGDDGGVVAFEQGDFVFDLYGRERGREILAELGADLRHLPQLAGGRPPHCTRRAEVTEQRGGQSRSESGYERQRQQVAEF